ncbi:MULTISPECIES: hypothetical protein [unclassified Cupriavidus]|uniref:hypothetical protein n=1 Tax=unclassified Cupriavidus TaxID=2640874 RepID=UPI001BFFF867|nr:MULTISPECIES: hypothetical protein [unclassified Cupriavidus]MCA3187010.1 hypothetical protein [Cupriavidus sp.]MCA3191643.1 hypothetical protein [Cupriavidus sp.]MCA3200116.1 hypothetical protein [Cupriavidus sp.]MCA3206359.1 hypothetical protein [Cupriavidus sp.]QWE97103.1 hypothetical protein KLP38_18280 [Cupriavidus sp. EM10]
MRIRKQLDWIRAMEANGLDTAGGRELLARQRALLAAQRANLAAFRRLIATYQARHIRPRFAPLHITLYRSGSRALLLPRSHALADVPAPVRYWLGEPVAETPADLTADTPMPGIPAARVRDELLRQGFCALDMVGVVRAFPDAELADRADDVAKGPARQ